MEKGIQKWYFTRSKVSLKLQKNMTKHADFKTHEGLKLAEDLINQIYIKVSKLYNEKLTYGLSELRNMVSVSYLLIKQAQQIKKNKGVFYIQDYATNFIDRYKNQLDVFIKNALKEDIGIADHTSLSCIDTKIISSAKLVVKESGYLAGVSLSKLIFENYDRRLKGEILIEDGNKIKKGDIAFVHGPVVSILATERLVLNTIQKMSGITSFTKDLNKMIKHTHCKILDTRKTTPNFRYAEKFAVMIGGGTNHRMGLFDAILIKDNHIDYCGGRTIL